MRTTSSTQDRLVPSSSTGDPSPFAVFKGVHTGEGAGLKPGLYRGKRKNRRYKGKRKRTGLKTRLYKGKQKRTGLKDPPLQRRERSFASARDSISPSGVVVLAALWKEFGGEADAFMSAQRSRGIGRRIVNQDREMSRQLDIPIMIYYHE